MSDYTIAPMTRADLDLALAWAAAEGWNPGGQDADCFYAADPQGFWLGRLKGEAIAAISVVKYSADFGFLGLYLVRPEFRGHGYGWRLWQAGLNYLAGCTIGLDGVVAQQANYRKSGFHLAYRNIRYTGMGSGTPERPLPEPLVPLATLPIATVLTYDRAFSPAPRAAFLRAWLTAPGHIGIGAVQAGQLVGYGVLRPVQVGYKVGPLFADTPALAEALWLALTALVPATVPVYLDVPTVNPAAIALAARYQLEPCFETARMYTQPVPDCASDRTYGLTTFELG